MNIYYLGFIPVIMLYIYVIIHLVVVSNRYDFTSVMRAVRIMIIVGVSLSWAITGLMGGIK